MSIEMDLLIEKSSRSTENSNINNDDIIDYTNLNCLLLIQNLSTLMISRNNCY
jgi:hypothetical protein